MDISQIAQADSTEITEIVKAALLRYNELFPQWEISTISIEKCSDRNEQIDRTIRFLQNLKD